MCSSDLSDFMGPVNIGSEEMVTINQLVETAAKVAGKFVDKEHIEGPLGVRGRNSINDLIRENEELRDRLAIGLMDGSEDEKLSVQSMINELREELRQKEIDINSLKINRDSLLRENAQLVRQCSYHQRLIKKLNDQLAAQRPTDSEPVPF